MPARSKKKDLPFHLARWIWPESPSWDLHNGYAIFRKEFSLPRVKDSHRIFLTADQSYQLYLNGRYICRGPARGFQESWPYDELEAARHLRKGRNVLAVRAYNPGFGNFQYISRGHAGLIVALDAGDQWIVSDDTWKCRRQKGVRRDTAPLSLQLPCQEHIDLREENPEWMRPNCQGEDWTALVSSQPWNGMPWHRLEERGIPMLEEKILRPSRLLGTSHGACAVGFRHTRDAAELRSRENLAHEACQGPARRITAPATGRGRFRSYLLDFGRTVVGSVDFEIAGAQGGEILDTLHVETIDATALTPDYKAGMFCRMAFSHRLICRPGSFSHAFYHAFGFRYLVVTLRDTETPLTFTTTLRTALYPLEVQAKFASSEKDWNTIWETCAWTQRCCSLDALVDTPWREQAQWWGDAKIQGKNTFFLSADTRLFRRGLAQIARQRTPDGLTYSHAPTIAHQCVIPDFTLVWLTTLQDYYWQTGSLEPFLSHQDAIRDALGYFAKMTDPKVGLLKYDPRYWLFLDWTETALDWTGIKLDDTVFFRNGYPTVYNLWMLIALDHLAALYFLSGQARTAKKLSAWAKRLRRALEQVTLPNGLLSDGLTWQKNVASQTSVHAQTLAILAGFRPEHDGTRITEILLPFIRQERPIPNAPSAYWTNYVFDALGTRGHEAEVLEFIRAKWLPMTKHGTTWEMFDAPVAEWSRSHAWSAHPLFHLMQILGGIRQTAANWREISFRPYFHGDYCETILPTPHGKIRSRWERRGKKISASLHLPPGVTARVTLPQHKSAVIHRGKGRWSFSTDDTARA